MDLDHIKFEIIKIVPIEDVINLYKEAGWWRESIKSKQVIDAMIQGSFCFMTATCDGKLVGMGRVISDGVSDGYIQDVIVKKEYRGLHIGEELMRRLVLFCIEKELEWIGLVAEPNTSSFYEKFGFRVLENHTPMLLHKELLP